MTKAKQSKNGCGCLPLTLLSIVAIGAGFYYGKNLIGTELTLESSMKITPQSAFVTSYISTNTNEWSQLNEFATPANRKIISTSFTNSLDNQFQQDKNKINYQEDIAPWIGGISVVALPSSPIGIDLEMVTIIGIKNKLKAFSFFTKQKDALNQEIKEQKYKKIKIYNLPENNNLWVTMFGNYLIVSDSENAIKKILDTYKGSPSLAKLYVKNTPKDSVFQVYFPEFDRLLIKGTQDIFPTEKSDQLSKTQLANIKSISFNLTIENYGLKLQTLYNFRDKIAQNKRKYSTISDKLLSKIPQDTIFMIHGGNINKVWQNIEAEKNNIPELDEGINELQQLFSNRLNLDLKNDFISWLDGEFTLAVSSFSANRVDGLILLESSNKNQGEKTLNKLNQKAKELPFVKVKQKKSKRIKVTEWSSVRQNYSLFHGWLNKDNLLITFGQDFDDISTLKKKTSLLNDEIFNLTIQSLPKDNYGYFYWNLKESIAIAESINPLLFSYISPEFKALSESLNAIAMTSSFPDSKTTQLDINLSLQKNQE